MKNNRTVSPCSVDGCDRTVGRTGGKGFCRKHYKRYRAHGSPFGGGTGKGEVKSFLDWVVGVETEECIQFPFYRSVYGYGRFNPPNGESMGAHVYVATVCHGDKPGPEYEACHSCGNGQNGCVNGKHIYWGTRKDNVHDAIAHGTAKFWGVLADRYAEFRNPMVAGAAKMQAANDNVEQEMAA